MGPWASPTDSEGPNPKVEASAVSLYLVRCGPGSLLLPETTSYQQQPPHIPHNPPTHPQDPRFAQNVLLVINSVGIMTFPPHLLYFPEWKRVGSWT